METAGLRGNMYFLSRRESKIEPRVSISLFTELTIVPRRNEQWISRNKTIRYHADSSVHTNGVIRQIFLPHLLHFNRSLDFFFPAILSLQNCCTTALQKGREKKKQPHRITFYAATIHRTNPKYRENRISREFSALCFYFSP